MPFNQLYHRPSFPPTQIHLSPSSHLAPSNSPSTPPTPDEIDENPISFFLTTPEDDFDFPSPEYDDLEDLSAGIEGSPEHKSLEAVREVSPSSLQRSRLPEVEKEDDFEEDDEEAMFGVGIPLSLKDFTRLSSSPPMRNRGSKTSDDSSEELKGLGITLSSSPPSRSKSRRGRAQVRLTPNVNPRGRARSLSARRPQSWRVPSPDIWRIEEEREDGDEKDGAGRLRELANGEIYSSSAPVQSVMVKAGEKKDKVKKRVHWAF